MARLPFYYPRGVDTQLLSAVTEWSDARESSGWIAVTSQPGRGNTSLLEHLHRQLSAAPLRNTVAPLLVSGRTAGTIDAPEPELTPIAAALFAVHVRTRDSLRMKFQRALRHAGLLRFLLYVLATLALLALITLAVGFFEYATENATNKYSQSWFMQFPAYVRTHEADVALWLLLSLLLTALTAALTSLHRVILIPAPARKPTGDEIDHFKALRDGPHPVDTLWDLTAGRDALVVLVDDAYALTLNEQLFLLELHHPPADKPALKQFREERRVLIVTIEMETTQGTQSQVWDEQKTRRRLTTTLNVSPFDFDQVAQIARNQFGPAGDDNTRLLEAAQHNIKALFSMDEHRAQERIVAEFDDAFEEALDTELGYADVLAMIAVGGQDYETRDDLGRWLKLKDDRMLRDHLAACGLEPPQSSGEILEHLKRSNLVRVSGRTFFYDEYGRLALRQYLAQETTGQSKRAVLARAHLYWFWYHSAAIRDLGVTPETLGTVLPGSLADLKRAMWHISELDQNFDATVIDRIIVDAPRRTEFQRAIAVVGGSAAATYAGEGRLTESDDCLMEAIELLPQGDGQWERWAERLLRQLWSNYWLSARGLTRLHLEEFVTTRPHLETTLTWRTARNVEDWMACAEGPSYTISEDVSDPELIDWRSLGEFLWRSRRADGFLLETLQDADVELPPIPRSTGAVVSILLLYLRCSAEIIRNANEGVEALKAWRDRLRRTATLPGHLTVEAATWCQRGMYYRLLTTAQALRRIAKASDAPALPGTAAVGGDLAALALGDSLRPEAGEFALQAEAAFERAIHLAMLLGLNGLALHVHHELAWLLLLHTAADDQRPPDWWRAWDRSFQTCLEIQDAHAGSLATLDSHWPRPSDASRLACRAYAAPIHCLRYEVFSRLTVTGSVQDAMLAYRTVRDARYPKRKEVFWFATAKTALGNFAQTDEQRRAAREMHIEWARTVAFTEEAAPYKDFEVIEHEQIQALTFAAQSSRQLREFDECDALLKEAEALYAAAAGPRDDERLRELAMWLRVQRLWLADARDDQDAYAEGLVALWPLIERQHDVAAALIASRARVERRQALDSRMLTPGRDDENDALSVPDTCMLRSRPHVSRAEFRLHQLLHLAIEPCPPSAEDVEAAASGRWARQNKYPEHLLTVLEFANDAKGTLVPLLPVLSSLYRHFATVGLEFRHELRALDLLILVDDASTEKWTTIKRDSLVRHRALLVREAAASATLSSSLVASASMVHRWLSDYEDSASRRRLIAERLLDAGWSPEAFQSQSEARSSALQAGRRLAATGRHTDAMATIAGVLPLGKQPWILLDDLEIMDLALQMAGDLDGYDVSAWITQTRALSLQYIRQLVDTMSERDVQVLAVELLEAVDGPAADELPGVVQEPVTVL